MCIRDSPYSNPTVTPQLGKLLSAIGNNTLSAKEIMEKTGMNDKRNFVKNYIHPAINSGLVLSLYPIGSKSPQQKYYPVSYTHLFGYAILMAVIGSMAAILIHEPAKFHDLYAYVE